MLSAKLYEFDIRSGRLIRYVLLSWKTLRLYRNEKPDLIFVQNPSILLSLLSVVYGKIFRVPVIVDAHNAGVFPQKWWALPLNRGKGVLEKVANFILRTATMTIVTNDALARYVGNQGGKPFILQDPLPEFRKEAVRKLRLKGQRNIFYICTYSIDEPYTEVMNAGKLLGNDIFIYVSGNFENATGKIPTDLPDNVVLTGFLKEEDFINMIFSCDVIIDLTTMDDCLVCGAYESVAAEKPVILSDSRQTRNYFFKGVIYTKNNSRDISQSIRQSLDEKELLEVEVSQLKKELIRSWSERRDQLERLVGGL